MFFLVHSSLYLALFLTTYIFCRFEFFIKSLFQYKNILFIIFMLIELLSFLNMIFYPLSREFVEKNPTMIFQGISYILIPQVFFYTAGSIIGTNQHSINKNISIILHVNFIMIIIGIILYLLRPDFYLNFQERVLGDIFNYYNGKYPRLTSYIGNSMIIGNISATSFILSIKYIRQKKKRNIFLFTFLFALILSFQRGAWISFLISLFLYYYLDNFFKNGKITLKKSYLSYIIILSLILPFLIYYFIDNYDIVQLYNRISSIGNALNERMYTWKYAENILKENIFGAGLGMLSHKSANLGFKYSIPDANYFRIAGEIGIFGFFIFLLILFIAIYITLRKKLIVLFSFFVIYIFQAIGTNVFDLYYCSFLFWFILGIIYSQQNKI